MPPGVRLEKTGHQSFSDRGIPRRGGERVQPEEPSARVRGPLLGDVFRTRRLAASRPEALVAEAKAAFKGDKISGAHPAGGEEGEAPEAGEWPPPLAPTSEW